MPKEEEEEESDGRRRPRWINHFIGIGIDFDIRQKDENKEQMNL